MILPDTLAPLPVAEDSDRKPTENAFVADSVVRQLLVGPMTVSRPRGEVEMVDFAGRADLGEEMLFSVPRPMASDGRMTAHPAFVPVDRPAAAPQPRGAIDVGKNRSSLGGLALVVGSGIAAAWVMAIGMFQAIPTPSESELIVPSVRAIDVQGGSASTPSESSEPLLVHGEWDHYVP